MYAHARICTLDMQVRELFESAHTSCAHTHMPTLDMQVLELFEPAHASHAHTRMPRLDNQYQTKQSGLHPHRLRLAETCRSQVGRRDTGPGALAALHDMYHRR